MKERKNIGLRVGTTSLYMSICQATDDAMSRLFELSKSMTTVNEPFDHRSQQFHDVSLGKNRRKNGAFVPKCLNHKRTHVPHSHHLRFHARAIHKDLGVERNKGVGQVRLRQYVDIAYTKDPLFLTDKMASILCGMKGAKVSTLGTQHLDRTTNQAILCYSARKPKFNTNNTPEIPIINHRLV